MHSRGVSILGGPDRREICQLSSTGKRNFASPKRTRLQVRDTAIEELRLAPMTWDAGRIRQVGAGAVDEAGERTESVCEVNPIPSLSDQKETGNTQNALLLIEANTSGMAPFADQSRRKIAQADGKVMDRGAECAAGGSYAL